MNFLRGLVIGAIAGAILAVLVYAQVTKPDPRNQARHDQAVAVQRMLAGKRDTLIIRDSVVRRRVDSVLIAAEPQIITIREALPDTLKPVLDSVIAVHREAIDSTRAVALAWRDLYDSTAAQLDTVMRFNAELIAQRKPSPIVLSAGVAYTPRGVQPAVLIGVRIPLPRIFRGRSTR